MNAVENDRTAPARRILGVFRRHWLFIVAFAVVVPVAATVYSLSQTKEYRAESTVLVNRQSLANQLSGAADVGLQQQSFQQVLTTQAQLARTASVLRATVATARRPLGAITVGRLRTDSTVTADPTSDLLRFAVTRPDPDDAKRLSLAYANAYVTYRLGLDSAALKKALTDIDQAISTARRDRPSSGTLIDRLSTSRQQLETRLALQTSNAQVVGGPEDAPQVSPRPARTAAFGLILGLVLGGAAAWLRELLDTRVRTGEAAETALGTPIIARLRAPNEKQASPPIVLRAPTDAAAEPFRVLRDNLAFGIRANDARVVLVTSSAQGEGKSTTISNLAVAAALAGQRVRLIDLDLRRPRLAELFGLDPTRGGVTSVVLGDTSLQDSLQDVPLPIDERARGVGAGSLEVLAAGPVPPNPGEFVGTPGVAHLLDEVRKESDLVLIDAPPVLAVSDTVQLLAYVDLVFLCVRLGLVTKPMLSELRASLTRSSTAVAGIAITGAGNDDVGYAGYYGYATRT